MKRVDQTNLYIISEREIQLKNPGSAHPRSTCPVCSDTRDHPGDPSVAWDLTTGVGYCHHCGVRFKIDNNPDSFGTPVHSAAPAKQTENRTDSQRTADYRSHLLPLDNNSERYLAARGISRATAIAAGICTRQVWQGTSWFTYVAFPFLADGHIRNVQYKAADLQEKRFFMESGGTLIPWNIRCIYEDHGWEPLYITEGMIDALALLECGCSYVISVPNGAESRMECFKKYRSQIKQKFAYIVFAGDTDEQGIKLRDRVTQYFDEKDVVPVRWQYGCTITKDADEMLMKCGKEGVLQSLRNAEMQGSTDLDVSGNNDSGLENLFRTGIPHGKVIGLEGFDNLVHFEEGNLLLVTGYPGSGKSTLVNYITMRLLTMYGWRTLFFSPEKMPQKYHEAELVSLLSGKKFDNGSLTYDEFQGACNTLGGNAIFIHEDITDIESIIRIARRTVRIYGIRILVIDPFVYLSMPAIPGASETQKIAVILKQLMLATRELNIFTILVAHPRKPSSDYPTEPSLYEVAGSANFYNFCDAGIIMERVKGTSNIVKITCGKSRRPFNGNLGECRLAYDVTCGRYAPVIKNKGAYTTEYRPFDRTPWYKLPPKTPAPLFAPDDIPQQYIDPEEQ